MAIRDFIHDAVDAVCDFFLKVWDTLVDLVKAAVRFVGRAVDFLGTLFQKSWNAIKSGAKQIYFIFFGEPNQTSSNKENEVAQKAKEMFGRIIAEKTEEMGRVPTAPIGIVGVAVVMDKNTKEIDEMEAVKIDHDITDPGMKAIVKMRDDPQNKDHAVQLVAVR